jgi:hypothetical protein
VLVRFKVLTAVSNEKLCQAVRIIWALVSNVLICPHQEDELAKSGNLLTKRRSPMTFPFQLLSCSSLLSLSPSLFSLYVMINVSGKLLISSSGSKC